jgi:hypothetical protein
MADPKTNAMVWGMVWGREEGDTLEEGWAEKGQRNVKGC